jgi:ribA/ribD-fused uncharacterized protein
MEDYPYVVKQNRKRLEPILKIAKQSPEIKSATLKQDQLFINGKKFTVNDLDSLPTCIHPNTVATVKNKNAIVFFSPNATFSNFHPLEITLKGKIYSCNEQYYQSEKAIFFGDTETAAKIMDTTDPYDHLALGKKVKGFKEDVWSGHAVNVLKEANFAKYDQHPKARQYLLSTGSLVIGEASRDTFFGIGLPIKDPNVCDTKTWKGQNKMGMILAEIRQHFK